MINRRSFLKGLGFAVFAPYVIRTPGLLMPVKNRNPLLAPYKGKMAFDAGFFYAPYIPLIRRVYPETIAREICSVQPMGAEVGEAIQYLTEHPWSFGRLSSTLSTTRNELFPSQAHTPERLEGADVLLEIGHEPHCSQASHIQSSDGLHNEPYNVPLLGGSCDVQWPRKQEKKKEEES